VGLKLKPEMVPTVDVSKAQWHLWENNLRGLGVFGEPKAPGSPVLDDERSMKV
jgi:hypothetical protein